MQESTFIEDWKPKITVLSKQNKHIHQTTKQSTKQCPVCSNTMLLLLGTLNTKYCTDCCKKIPWYLEPNQQPLL